MNMLYADDVENGRMDSTEGNLGGEDTPKDSSAPEQEVEAEAEGGCCFSEMEELRGKIVQLESDIEKIRKDHDRQLLEFIEKKTKEAAKIVADREREIAEKYKREFENSKKYIHERQLSELSLIVSQFESVMNSITNPEVGNYLVGFKMFFSKFKDLFDDFGITSIVPKEGDEFNSETMEATAVVEAENPESSDRISRVFSSGYRLHERIIKLASVEAFKWERGES